jgi:hypothetical protein
MNKIQLSCLGKMGRFGNQLFQYAFAKSYANKYNCTLEIPADWPGRGYFGISDPVLESPLPKTELDLVDFGEINIDLYGFFQHQKFLDIMDPDEVRSWFRFDDYFTNKFTKPTDFYVAAHMRLGDYIGGEKYCTISKECYTNICAEFGYNASDLIYVTEDKRQPGDTGDMGFIYDFMLLMNSDVLFRSNSTFGWWAAFLGDCDMVYSPVVQDKAGQHGVCVDFVEGNHPCHMQIDDRHSDLYLG